MMVVAVRLGDHDGTRKVIVAWKRVETKQRKIMRRAGSESRIGQRDEEAKIPNSGEEAKSKKEGNPANRQAKRHRVKCNSAVCIVDVY
ncbi:hypothetical protein U1Q18_042860 [Sarracenia purpurea var. burkii]